MTSPVPDRGFRAVSVSTEDSAVTGLRKTSTRNQDQQRHRRPGGFRQAPLFIEQLRRCWGGEGVLLGSFRCRHGLACPLGAGPPLLMTPEALSGCSCQRLE